MNNCLSLFFEIIFQIYIYNRLCYTINNDKDDSMNDFPILDNNEIILRKLENNDFDRYFEYVMDEEISSQFNFNYNRETAKLRFDEIIKKYSNDVKPFIWVIALKETNEFVGMITVDTFSNINKRFSIAYGIIKKYRGNNNAYKASRLLIDYMFDKLDMNRVELAHIIDNIASQRVIEKLGAKYEGVAREFKFYINGFKDCKIYSILKNEWLENNR